MFAGFPIALALGGAAFAAAAAILMAFLNRRRKEGFAVPLMIPLRAYALGLLALLSLASMALSIAGK